MNILHTETLERWGGQQNRVLSESRGLLDRGQKVIIACNKGSTLAEKARIAGIRVYELEFKKNTYHKTIPQLIRIIRDEDIEIVSTHSSIDSWAAGFAARITGRHLVRFRHNLFPVGRDPLTRLIYRMPERIIAISESVRNVLRDSRVAEEKISVIPSSVDAKKFNLEAGSIRNELNIPLGSVIIGNTSTFSRTKGQQYLFRALNIISEKLDCYLLFAGSTTEHTMRKYLPEVSSNLRDRVIFLGQRDDVPEILNSLDIFVYPSVIEGLGTALLEAMATGRPVVVSDIPTFREFIEDGINGIFFRPEDHEDLATKVVNLLRDEALRKRLGENARMTILQRFTENAMVDKTESLYKSMLRS